MPTEVSLVPDCLKRNPDQSLTCGGAGPKIKWYGGMDSSVNPMN